MTMYKYTVETILLDGYSVPEERRGFGKDIDVCFSRSPKKACSWEGVRVHRHEGDDATPIICHRTLTRGSTVIFDVWD